MENPERSILLSTKKVLDIHPDDDSFDLDVVMHINTVLADLNDFNVGPERGFEITSEDDLWTDFMGTSMLLNPVKSYVFLRVKQIFTPEAVGSLDAAMQRQIDKMEYQINRRREEELWRMAHPVLG